MNLGGSSVYKIGEFSKITGLTVKALRYYDEQEILVPSSRGENNYRLYNEQDFEKAVIIKLLRSFEFSILEIRDVLSLCSNSNDLHYVLREKQEMIKQTIIAEKKRIKKLEQYLAPINTDLTVIEYEIVMKEVAPINIASIRFKGHYSDLDKYVPILYNAVKDLRAGSHFNIYYDEECMEEADIELCLPTKKLISMIDSEVKQRSLPALKALTTVHKGSYDNLKYAYKALFDYAATHSLTLMTPSREIYIKGPGMLFKGNQNNYITEILMPFSIIESEKTNEKNN